MGYAVAMECDAAGTSWSQCRRSVLVGDWRHAAGDQARVRQAVDVIMWAKLRRWAANFVAIRPAQTCAGLLRRPADDLPHRTFRRHG